MKTTIEGVNFTCQEVGNYADFATHSVASFLPLFMRMLQNVDLQPGLKGMGKLATLKLVDWIAESTSLPQQVFFLWKQFCSFFFLVNHRMSQFRHVQKILKNLWSL